MSQGLFLIVDGELRAMTPGAYVDEDELQTLVERYPDLIPGGLIDTDSPRRWLVIAREPGLAAGDGEADRFKVDHLFVDQDAIPTLIEVKRSTDTRIRREVVGQMLDYAANSVRHWDVPKMRQWLTERTGSEAAADNSVLELLDAPADDGDAVERFWAQAEANLTAGRLRLLFVADSLPPELAAIIEFLNEQMHRTEVLGVAISRHQDGSTQLLSPTIVGKTAASAPSRRRVNPIPLSEAIEQSDPATQEVGRRLESLAEDRGWEVRIRPQSKIFHTDPTGSIVTWYPSLKTVEFYVGVMRDVGMSETADRLHIGVTKMAGKSATDRHPNIPCAQLLDNWDTFIRDWLDDYQGARAEYFRRSVEATGEKA